MEEDLRSLDSYIPRKVLPNGIIAAETVSRTSISVVPTTGNIAAIDFGTSNCSLAYSTGGDDSLNLLTLSSQEGQVRVPTILLVNDHGEPVKFGNRAIREYQTMDPDEQLKYHLFERIKLSLGPSERICRDTKIPDTTGKMFFLRDVIALFLQYLKNEFERCFKMLNIPVQATDFHWVITVPAIWNASGKQMMREAAYQAGLCGMHNLQRILMAGIRHLEPLEIECPEQLSLALEPEAASFHCRTMVNKDVTEYCASQQGALQSKRYIVIDIGGGTADISAHGQTSEGGIEVLTPPEGNMAGGFAVNREFQLFLARLVNDPGFQTYLNTGDKATNIERWMDIRHIVYEEFEQEKKEFGQTYLTKFIQQNPDNLDENSKVFRVQLTDSFYSFYKSQLEKGIHELHMQNDRHIELKRKKLNIQYTKMEEFFHSSVSMTLKSLSNVLRRLNNEIDIIYLVGGFGGCQYIYHSLKTKLDHDYGLNQFQIIVPKNAHLAVVKGAFQYCKHPEVIKSRVADATYGTETTLEFDPAIHSPDYKKRKRNGGLVCSHLFSPLVMERETILSNMVKRNIYQPVEPNQTSVQFNLISSEDPDLFYTRNPNGTLKPGVKVLASIILPSPDISKGTDRDLYLTFDFSLTEIQVRAYDKTSKIEKRVVIDCLDKQWYTEDLCQAPLP